MMISDIMLQELQRAEREEREMRKAEKARTAERGTITATVGVVWFMVFLWVMVAFVGILTLRVAHKRNMADKRQTTISATITAEEQKGATHE